MSSLRPNELAALKATRNKTPGPAGGVIESDRKCLGCSYQLKGLPIGSNCPECGMPTQIPTTIDDPLSLMPIEVISRLKWGCWAVFWCLLLAMTLGFVYAWHRLPDAMVLSALAAVSASWQVAVRFATPALNMPQATIRGMSSRGKLRFAAQWLQLGWLIAAVSALMMLAITKPTAQTDVLIHLLRGGLVIGLIGLTLLALHFERLAEWARDDMAQRAFNTIAWGLPFAVAMLLWTPTNVLLALAIKVIAIMAMLVFPFGVLVLAKSVGYSVHHAIEHEMRQERQQDRRERFFGNVVDTYVEATAGEEVPIEDPSLEPLE